MTKVRAKKLFGVDRRSPMRHFKKEAQVSKNETRFFTITKTLTLNSLQLIRVVLGNWLVRWLTTLKEVINQGCQMGHQLGLPNGSSTRVAKWVINQGCQIGQVLSHDETLVASFLTIRDLFQNRFRP